MEERTNRCETKTAKTEKRQRRDAGWAKREVKE
jgi:hypothetical protein